MTEPYTVVKKTATPTTSNISIRMDMNALAVTNTVKKLAVSLSRTTTARNVAVHTGFGDFTITPIELGNRNYHYTTPFSNL